PPGPKQATALRQETDRITHVLDYVTGGNRVELQTLCNQVRHGSKMHLEPVSPAGCSDGSRIDIDSHDRPASLSHGREKLARARTYIEQPPRYHIPEEHLLGATALTRNTRERKHGLGRQPVQ